MTSLACRTVTLVFLCVASVASAASPPPRAAQPPPAYVWVHPVVPDMFAMTVLYDARHREIEFEKISGRTGMIRFPVTPTGITRMLEVLGRAEALGTSGCDTLPPYPGRAQVWAVTLIDTTATGKLKIRGTTPVSLEAARCRAREELAAGPPQGEEYGLRQLAALGGNPTPATNTPVLSPSWVAINRLRVRDRLIADAGALPEKRRWEGVGFDVWTAHAAAGRGVRLSIGALPPMADDPMAPTAIHVSGATLRAVIEQFLGRREIEISGNFPREEFIRGGITGRVGAIESTESTRTHAVFANDMLPSEAEGLARETMDFLATREPVASRQMQDALALGNASKTKAPPPLDRGGPAPLAITLSPTTGEDFVAPMLVLPDRARFLKPGPFTREGWTRPDADLSLRGSWFTAGGGEREVAAMASLLERAAVPDSAPCDPLPQYPAWPPTWKVRFFDHATDSTAHVLREFEVPIRRVRCLAVEAYDAPGRSGDPRMRSAMETLSKLGVNQYAAREGLPAPRLAPDLARAALLALARGPVGQERTAVLDVALSWSRSSGRAIRFAVLKDRTLPKGDGDPDVISVDDATLRHILDVALSDSMIVAGLARTRSTFPRKQEHGEFRVLERSSGLMHPVPVVMAYVEPRDAEALARRLLRELEKTDPAAADRVRSVLAFDPD